MRPKRQRLVLVTLALAALVGAALLAMWGLKDKAAYFVTPSDLAAHPVDSSRAVRLGGLVERGSLKRSADGLSIIFTVTDGQARTQVGYRGITPDLFREGSGMIAEGKVAANGRFEASTILAKHDENYHPPQMGPLPKTIR